MPPKKESNEPQVEKLLNDFGEEVPELGFTDEQLECIGRTLLTAVLLREEPAKTYWTRLEKDRNRQNRRKGARAMTDVPTTPAAHSQSSSGSRKQILLPKAASAMKRKTPNVARSKAAATSTKKKGTTFVATPTKTVSRNSITEMDTASGNKLQKVDEIDLVELSPKTQAFLRLSPPEREQSIQWNLCNNTSGLREFVDGINRIQNKADERLFAAQKASKEAYAASERRLWRIERG